MPISGWQEGIFSIYGARKPRFATDDIKTRFVDLVLGSLKNGERLLLMRMMI